MLKEKVKLAREKVRGIEHFLFGITTSVIGVVLTVMEHLQNQDISAFLQKVLPDGWTPPEVMALMGIAIIVLHAVIGNQYLQQPPPCDGGK